MNRMDIIIAQAQARMNEIHRELQQKLAVIQSDNGIVLDGKKRGRFNLKEFLEFEKRIIRE